MEHCFFLTRKRDSYFNIEKVLSEYSGDISLELIVDSEHEKFITQNFKEHLNGFYVIDELSFEACREVIESSIGRTDVNGKSSIVCTDEPSLIIAAKLREYFNIEGAKPHRYVPFENKRIMKQILAARGIKIPNFVDFNGVLTAKSLSSYHDYIVSTVDTPYIVKPIASGGSQRVGLIRDYGELKKWYSKNFSADIAFEINEFIYGKMYHCDSFIVDGEIKFSAVSEYMYPCLEFVCGKPLGSFPLDENDELYGKILKFNSVVLEALNIPDGASHLEVIVTPNGDIIFIEIGARPPGAVVCFMHEKNYGINLYEMILRYELGMDIDFTVKGNPFFAWVYLSTYPGTIKSINEPVFNSDADIRWHVKNGDVIGNFPSSIISGSSAHILLHNPDYKGLLADIDMLRDYVPYEIYGAD